MLHAHLEMLPAVIPTGALLLHKYTLATVVPWPKDDQCILCLQVKSENTTFRLETMWRFVRES